VVGNQQEPLVAHPVIVLGDDAGQLGLGPGIEITGQKQVQNRHEVAFATAETAVEVGALARAPLQRRLHQAQGRIKALRQLLGDHVVGHRLAGLGHAFAQAHDEVAAGDVFGQVNQITKKGHGGKMACGGGFSIFESMARPAASGGNANLGGTR
jgi:hypothetical protein